MATIFIPSRYEAKKKDPEAIGWYFSLEIRGVENFFAG